MAVPIRDLWPGPWTPSPADSLSGALLVLPLWWVVGRGADALIALKRKAIHPRIRFAEAAISFLLLMAGALFTVIGLYFALSGRGSWAVVASTLSWAFLGGLSVRAWHKQRHPFEMSATIAP